MLVSCRSLVAVGLGSLALVSTACAAPRISVKLEVGRGSECEFSSDDLTDCIQGSVQVEGGEERQVFVRAWTHEELPRLTGPDIGVTPIDPKQWVVDVGGHARLWAAPGQLCQPVPASGRYFVLVVDASRQRGGRAVGGVISAGKGPLFLNIK
jgi:hypothetical protein